MSDVKALEPDPGSGASLFEDLALRICGRVSGMSVDDVPPTPKMRIGSESDLRARRELLRSAFLVTRHFARLGLTKTRQSQEEWARIMEFEPTPSNAHKKRAMRRLEAMQERLGILTWKVERSHQRRKRVGNRVKTTGGGAIEVWLRHTVVDHEQFPNGVPERGTGTGYHY
jgi:hypothetical protein